jgi:PAS domain S-box-containing protein
LIARQARKFPLLPLERLSRGAALLCAALVIAAVAVIDWRLEESISFGFLYLFPMLIVGVFLTRAQIAAVAALCTGLTEAFDPFPWSVPLGIPRVILTFAAFLGMGLYGFGSARSRRAAREHLRAIEEEADLRRRTEEQLEFLISNSPVTILTVNEKRNVLLANDAAHRLLGVENGKLPGRPIATFFPALASVPPSARGAPAFHTEMECRGKKENGDVFLAHIWFSTYQTMSGPRLAAIVFDASDEFRDRAEFSLQQMLAGSNVLVSALCHEIRNVSGAIAAVHAKLLRDGGLPLSEDFQALGTLVRGLERMASLELRQTTRAVPESVDLRAVLEELRIVIAPSFEDAEISISWDVPEHLPRVWADRQALLQAFLNIVKNSQRAMERQDRKHLSVRTSQDGNFVTVRFFDTGPGVSDPRQLFEPFQPGAQASGLGLYLSRTFVRVFNGDLCYEPQAEGCCFAVLLAKATDRNPSGGEAV